MNTAAIITVITIVAAISAAGIHFTLRMRRYREAEQVLGNFFEFNREVSKQLSVLEDQGRLCYQSLDGDAMRLIFEAQKAVSHGHKLEQLGVDALAAGNPDLLAEVCNYFNLEAARVGAEFGQATSIDELSPSAYKVYAVSLIQKIDQKVKKGLENRHRLSSLAAVA